MPSLLASKPKSRPKPSLLSAVREDLERDFPRERPSWWSSALAFARDCVAWPQGEQLTPYQEEVLEQLPICRRYALRTPHGAGKTAVAAILVLWFSLSREAQGLDWKIPCTASAWRQLSRYLFPEIRKWSRRLKWENIGRPPFDAGRELMYLNLKLDHGEAFAVASNDAATMEGAHAAELLYLFDEAKTIPGETFDAAEGALSTGNCFALVISTPGEPQGRFYEIQSRKAGFEDWTVRHVTQEECVAAGRMSAEWAEQRRLQWGDSAVYKNRVLGEFASSESDGLIPLSWVEQANERHAALEDSGEWSECTRVGCDIGRGGDRSVLALRHGAAIRELRRFHSADTMQTTGEIAAALTGNPNAVAIVDVIGIGAGVVDKLREDGRPVIAFNAGEGTDFQDRSGELQFVNKRSAAWWSMRELLDPANGHGVSLPPDDLLTGDLTAPHWRMTSGGKVQIESKDDIRKRLGRSTDDGDAVVQAFWQDTAEPGPSASEKYWGPL